MKTPILLIVHFSSATLLSAAAVDFNNYNNSQDNDLVNSFHIHGDQSSFFQVQSGGISGGAVQATTQSGGGIDSQSHDGIYSLNAVRNNAGDGFAVSALFKLAATAFPNTSGSVGFVSGFNVPLREPLFPGVDAAAFRASFTSSGFLQIESMYGNNGYASPVSSLSPVAGNWYLLTLAGVHNPGGDFTLTSTLQDFGASGTQTPTVTATATLTRPNPRIP